MKKAAAYKNKAHDISIKIQNFSHKKTHLQMFSVKFQPFYSGAIVANSCHMATNISLSQHWFR